MPIGRRDFMEQGIITLGVLSLGSHAMAASTEEKSLFPSHPAIGVGQGIHPGRVAWVHEPKSVHWDGLDFWWKPENFDSGHIRAMITNGLTALTGESTPQQAWNALFAWHNGKKGKSGSYKPGEKVAIKVNMNGAGENNDDRHGRYGMGHGNPVLLQSLLQSLVRDGGVRPEDITVFDTCRIFPDHMQKMCTKDDLAGVKFSFRDIGGKQDSVPDKNAQINWAGQVQGAPTHFPTCLTEADYLINLGNLKGHTWGMTLGAKNHFGSFINRERRTTPAAAGLHPNIIHGKMGDYSVLADLLAQNHIGGKTILTILDALITAPDETTTIWPENSVWEMAPFNGQQAASLFFSQDPVAIDSVGADFLVNEPNMKRHNSNMTHKPEMENYLHEAALLGEPPSGTKYGKGKNSLGVHEHWNNAEEKLYGRNLGRKEGIELVKVGPGAK